MQYLDKTYTFCYSRAMLFKRLMMKKGVFVLLAVVLVGAGVFAAMRLTSTPSMDSAGAAESGAAAPAFPDPSTTARAVVDGRVVPLLRADLSLPISGIVAEVLVTEGAAVTAGQPLLRLHAEQQSAAVAQAEAQLARAQARLNELNAGAQATEIAAATAVRDQAQARLDRIQNGPLPAESAVARATLAEAQARLQGVLAGASQQQRIAVEAELANAQAALRQAQAAYDQVAGLADVGARPEAARLEQATNTVRAAQARLDDLNKGGSSSDVAAARAGVQRATAQLELVTATDPAALAEAQAALRQAQAQLDLLAAGARPEAIAAAEADVALAQATVDQAKAALADAELAAPFAGVVAGLDVAAGEQVTAGQDVIRLADLSVWQIETEDLTEFDVVGVQPGDAVQVSFDALPDLELAGTVNRIRPIGEDNRGDIVYTLLIDPAQQDERLLWNMTAVVRLQEK